MLEGTCTLIKIIREIQINIFSVEYKKNSIVQGDAVKPLLMESYVPHWLDGLGRYTKVVVVDVVTVTMAVSYWVPSPRLVPQLAPLKYTTKTSL